LKQDAATRQIPVIFITARDESASIVTGFEVGGVDYITKPFQPAEVLIRVATHLKIHRLARELLEKNNELQAEINKRQQVEVALQNADNQLSVISEREAKRWGLSGLVGKSPAFLKIVQEVKRTQKFPATSVLLTGESGSGKELIARAIHYGSPLARGPFVPVNCAAIPGELAESSFFGHARGAFSGATADHKGYFEQAHEGTLFLDEVGDMPLGLQVKLLRVLEDGIIVPVGSEHPKKMDVRILAGTNADLQSSVTAHRFRGDLYFRLARFTIEVPSLRDRRDDIPLLAEHFLRLFATEMGMTRSALSPEALAILQEYEYPGNVRELKNLVERALIESGGGVIAKEHLHFVQHRRDPEAPTLAPPGGEEDRASPGSKGVTPRPGGELERIIAYVREHGTINNTECRDLLSVGMQRACYLLRKACSSGLLKRSSTGRWTQYQLP
jgi:DNA-binding NtrC family response regulator